MSKHETPMTEGFWKSIVGGTYMAEYQLVRKSSDTGCRLADAVILPDEPDRHLTSKRDYLPIVGRDVVVVQTKASRMGMYLMGQAVFSSRLVMRAGAASVRSILLCNQSDAALLPFLDPYPEVEVWLCEAGEPMSFRRVQSPTRSQAPAYGRGSFVGIEERTT